MAQGPNLADDHDAQWPRSRAISYVILAHSKTVLPAAWGAFIDPARKPAGAVRVATVPDLQPSQWHQVRVARQGLGSDRAARFRNCRCSVKLDRTKFPGQRRVTGMLWFRVALVLGGTGHDHCDDLVHRSTVSAAAHSGSGIGVSWGGRSAPGAGPDGLARRVVAFSFLIADLDAVGGVFRPCRGNRLSKRLSSVSLGSTGVASRSRSWRLSEAA